MDAIYARQSIDKKDSLSIEGQIEFCRKFAAPDALIFQDKGFSGKNTNRPAFTELIHAVESGEIDKLFVYRLDRFSRSIADFSRLWELLEKHHVEFNSVTERFDTGSPMGRAMLNIILVFAQLERETTAERVRDNYQHRFSLGAWPGGPAPYGFTLVKLAAEGRTVSSLAANEKAQIVRQIFEAYAEPGTSLRSIAKALTSNGIHGPKREAWDNVTLSRILHSPLYVQANQDIYFYYLSKGLQIQQEPEAFDGRHACNVIGRRDRSRNKYHSLDGQMLTVANHEGFIPPSLWVTVQDKLAKNPQISRANAGKYTWLSGLLKCGECGYALKVNFVKAENRCRLLCSGRSNFSACDADIRIDLRQLETNIAAEMKSTLSASPPGEMRTDTQETAKAILEVDAKIERLVLALAESSTVSVSYISKEIDKLHAQREAFVAKSTSPSVPARGIDFDSLSFNEKKMVAAEFIERIQINGNHVNIVWKA